uniref:Uncharacterized protein n=1 Tax=Arion vulgaris TaxID=1028688 RepID=A0A0B7A5E3_9EUPU
MPSEGLKPLLHLMDLTEHKGSCTWALTFSDVCISTDIHIFTANCADLIPASGNKEDTGYDDEDT